MKIIEKVALAVIKDKKVLLARSRKNKAVFYTLGGKIEPGETDVQCLVREVKEEVATDLDSESLAYLGTFEANAHDKVETVVRIKLYTGKLIGDPVPSSEVEEIAYFDSAMSEEHHSALTREVIDFLKRGAYIN